MQLKTLILIPTLLITLMPLHSSAQDTLSRSTRKKNTDSFWRRVNVGGNLGFTFGSVTGIVVSPEISIRTINHLYTGLGFTYQYFYQKDYFWNRKTGDFYNYSGSVIGGRIFARYYLRSIFSNFLGNFFPHAEYEYLYYSYPFVSDPKGDIEDPYYNRYSPGKTYVEVNSLFVGAGYSQPVAGRAYMDFLILFNLNDSYHSPYTNPVFRIGFGIGL